MARKRTPLPATVPYNDLDLTRWKELTEIWTGSLWNIPARARGDGHSLDYHGNFVPQIATQTFLRFSKEGEIVLDLFLGSGTSALEAVRLNRRCVGVELQPEMVEAVRAKCAGSEDRVRLLCGDSAVADTPARVRSELAGWGADLADLLMLHPPYAGIIRFSEDPHCLSNAGDTPRFLDLFGRVARNGYELLRPGRFAVLVIGDRYEKGELDPLGFRCLQVMNEVGFRTKSIIVKNIAGNEIGKGQSGNLWKYRALRGGFYLFQHEYVMLFQKPERRKRDRSRDE